jgi:hypothetical protein
MVIRPEEHRERRLTTRHATKTKVYIRHNGKMYVRKACNLSAQGVAIQTNNLQLKRNDKVRLAFAINLGECVKIHFRHATVAHVSKGVTGFMMIA